MKLQIIKPGLLTTIQDLGRPNFRDHGVPVSGAMDGLSARVANLVLGNNENAAVIEFTYADAVIKAESDLLICRTGEGAFFKAGDIDIPSARPVFIPAGTNIKLSNHPSGSRTYLAVAGGWDVPLVMGSRSTYITAKFGGLNGRALVAGDELRSNPKLSPLTKTIHDELKGDAINYPTWSASQNLLPVINNKIIRVIPGREFSWFSAASVDNLFSEKFKLGNDSNRMGCRLKGPAITRENKTEMLSTAVMPGTIQVTHNNELILLMADCQTTGGYPRIAQVAAVDLPLCGQLKPGDEIIFQKIDRQEAGNLLFKQEQDIKKLISSLRNRYNIANTDNLA